MNLRILYNESVIMNFIIETSIVIEKERFENLRSVLDYELQLKYFRKADK